MYVYIYVSYCRNSKITYWLKNKQKSINGRELVAGKMSLFLNKTEYLIRKETEKMWKVI